MEKLCKNIKVSFVRGCFSLFIKKIKTIIKTLSIVAPIERRLIFLLVSKGLVRFVKVGHYQV